MHIDISSTQSYDSYPLSNLLMTPQSMTVFLFLNRPLAVVSLVRYDTDDRTDGADDTEERPLCDDLSEEATAYSAGKSYSYACAAADIAACPFTPARSATFRETAVTGSGWGSIEYLAGMASAPCCSAKVMGRTRRGGRTGLRGSR